MIAILIIGGMLVVLTSILATRGAAFWTLPVIIAVTTVLIAGLVHFGSPWWTYPISVIIAVLFVVGTLMFTSMRWLFAAGLAVIMAIALLTSAFATGSPVAGAKVDAASIASKLTVSPEDILPSTVKCESDVFLDNSRAAVNPSNPLLRTWSYSVSTPIGSSDPTVILNKMFAENCGNPTVLDMNIQWLASLDIQGFKVGNANPWMGKHLAQAANPGLRTSYLTKKVGEPDSSIFVTTEYQSLAAMVNELLTRFDVIGVGSWQSTSNWHLDGAGLVVGELPRASLNPNQENLPALRLELTDKGVGCVFAGGFNIADKRWEQFNCTTPTTTTTKPPTTISTTVPPGHFVPPTTTPPTTKPPTTCPPTTCLTPKSTNTSYYRQPGDSGKGADVGTGVKPPVTAETTAQAAPPVVVTTKPSAITAPGAVPPPATTTTPPPNQGGGGTGTVGAFN